MNNLNNYIGKSVLLGITYLNEDNSVHEQIQVHGTITRVDDDKWLVLSRKNGEGEFRFPPKLKPASPGEYRLRSTGEVVTNPDFLGVWSVHPPSNK